MFELPGFDPKTLTDEQLLDRSQDLSRKIAFASQFSSNGGLDTMLKMSDAIDHERRERAFMARWQRVEPIMAQPIETDPDLRDAALARSKPEDGSDKARPRPRVTGMRRPTPTATPTVPSPKSAEDRPIATTKPQIEDKP